jgi:HTH-type transcriptional regulator / antitoxin HipB|tara:strand:- start:4900 stop:5295 length:396 start_codon:yes stop_codon:yes gene_type:complete
VAIPRSDLASWNWPEVRKGHIDSIHTLGQSLRAARTQLGLTQAQLSSAAGVGLRFIVELEAGKPTLRLEHVLRVIKALGGELNLSGLSSAPADAIAARPLSDADQPARHAVRHQALDELIAQARALKMGYE